MKVLTRTYAFDDEQARARLKALGDYWWKKHGIACEWRGHTVRLVGKKLGVKYDATVTIDEGEVRAEV